MSTNTPNVVKKERKTACRLFGFLFLLVGAVVIALIPFGFLNGEAGVSMALYNAVLTIFGGFMNAAEGVINTVYNVAIYAFAALSAISALLALIALFSGKRGFVKASAILVTVGAFLYTILYTVTYFVANNVFAIEFMSLIVAAVALVATIVCIIVTRPIVEVVEEEKEEKQSGFHVEEYAEAYPYEGGPVAGVLMAEEVNPSFIPQSPRVNTAGYDFYNSKSFDTFISTLNDQERNEFTEIFILKVKGNMPELPDYEVGGDNKEFFRKIFIYLGQYRDRLPDSLLGKIYQYSLKLN